MKIRRMIIAMVVAVVLVVCGLLAIYSEIKARTIPSLDWGEFVYDNANVISREDEATLNGLLSELNIETDAVCYVVSMKSSQRMDVSAYADKAFTAMGLAGYEGSRKDCVLVCFSKNEKEIAVKTTSRLNDVVDETMISRISSKYYTPFVEKEPSKAIEGTSTSITMVVAAHYDADVTNLRFSGPYSGNAFVEFAIIAGALILFLIAIIVVSNKSGTREN